MDADDGRVSQKEKDTLIVPLIHSTPLTLTLKRRRKRTITSLSEFDLDETDKNRQSAPAH